MTRRHLLFSALLLLAVLSYSIWLSTKSNVSRRVRSARPEKLGAQDINLQPAFSVTPVVTSNPAVYTQISLKARTQDEAIKEYLFQRNKDHDYDWKVSINFYGKLIDQFNNPVAKATVHFQWVNRSGPQGISERVAETNNEGRFSIGGITGKNLGLKITKAGYYDVSHRENQLDFEFASPAERTFYEPDPAEPVTIHIRAKGKGDSLSRKTLELQPSSDGTAVFVDLLSGCISAAGQLKVRTWKPFITPDQRRIGNVFPYDWRIVLNIEGGGFVSQNEAFPFEAPDSGYNSVIDMSLHATDGASSGVTAQQSCYFCFGKPTKYGIMHFKSDGDRPYLDLEYSLNPSGSRNLEPASADTDKN